MAVVWVVDPDLQSHPVEVRQTAPQHEEEQDRLRERFDAAVGTSSEYGAYVRLRAAGDQVTAREAWFQSVAISASRARQNASSAAASGNAARSASASTSNWSANRPAWAPWS